MHSICSLTCIIKCITPDAQRLLAACSQLGLLMSAAHMHRKWLALRSHQLVVATILISWYLVSEQIHLVMVAASLSKLCGHEPHLLRWWIGLCLKPVLLRWLALRLLLLESTLLLSKLILELDEVITLIQKCSDIVTYLNIFLISIWKIGHISVVNFLAHEAGADAFVLVWLE